jgi:hypothetical protein
MVKTRSYECLLWVAVSIGRCNTLSENHCLEKMFLNQGNSERINGTPRVNCQEHRQADSKVSPDGLL